MMLTKVNVSATLTNVVCHRQQDQLDILLPGSEPYLWALFFSIDGNGFAITDPPQFLLSTQPGGTSVLATNGAHGNLTEQSVTANANVAVPASVGNFDYQASAMALPFPCDPLKPEGVLGVVGMALLLWEEDNFPDDSAVAGYAAFESGLKTALDAFLNGRSIFAGEPTQEDIDALSEEVAQEVEKAIKSQIIEGPLGIIFQDDQLVQKVFTFSLEKLLEEGGASLNARTAEGTEDWEVNGVINASLACAFEASSRALSRRGERPLDLDPFREFRDRQLDRLPHLALWADLAGRNTASITRTLLGDPEARAVVREVMAMAADALRSPEKTLPPQLLRQAGVLFDRMSATGTPRARRDFRRLRQALTKLEGRSTREAFELLNKNLPPSSRLARRPVRPRPA